MADIIANILGMRSWFIKNLDTGQELQGQFEPTDVTENIGSKYAQHGALNRKHPIIQFLQGEAETITFNARLYSRDFLFSSVKDDLDLLKSWTRRDDALSRPPVVSFWVGDGHIAMDQCVIVSLGGIAYGGPTALGAIRDVKLSISLLKYVPFSLEESGSGETRYHRARIRDYYEILTFREYGEPMIGDVIRKRHPSKPNIQVADTIKLPSIEVLRKEKVTQKSIPLSTSYGKKATPQRDLRLDVFGKHNRIYVSHVL